MLLRSLLLIVLTMAACTPPLASPTPPPAAAPTAAPAAQAPAAQAPAAQAAPAQAAPQPSDPAVQAAMAKYYEAAKQEGKLVVYGVGNPTLYTPIHDAFVKRFPGIDLQGVDQRGRESR